MTALIGHLAANICREIVHHIKLSQMFHCTLWVATPRTMLFTLILSFLPLTLASPTKRANPTIQFVNECSVNVQPYITGDNPSGLPNPDVLEPGKLRKVARGVANFLTFETGDAATYTFDQTFVGTIYALEAGVADIEHYIQAGFSLMDNYYWLVS